MTTKELDTLCVDVRVTHGVGKSILYDPKTGGTQIIDDPRPGFSPDIVYVLSKGGQA